jgi:hypothetical protein
MDAMADFGIAWRSGKGQKSARISFASPELLWELLTAKRWDSGGRVECTISEVTGGTRGKTTRGVNIQLTKS